jgi:hypothetical protein
MQGLKEFLDQKVEQYNQPGFIFHDPISIPHIFRISRILRLLDFLPRFWPGANEKRLSISVWNCSR